MFELEGLIYKKVKGLGPAELQKRHGEQMSILRSAWNQVESCNYSQALKIWEDYIARRDYFPYYRPPYGDRGIVYLLLGDYTKAIDDFNAKRTGRYEAPSRHTYDWIGTALWLNEEYEAACRDWADELELLQQKKTTHAVAGGIGLAALLWWASSHAGFTHWQKLAETHLKRIARTSACRNTEWPGSIAPYLLGQISAPALYALSASSVPELEARQRCQAYFYMGAMALRKGNADQYMDALHAAISPGHIIEVEYHLALKEYKMRTKSINLPYWRYDEMIKQETSNRNMPRVVQEL